MGIINDKNKFYENNFLEDVMVMSSKYFMFMKLMKKYSKGHERFLDFGCGAGSFMNAVKNEVGVKEVYGCDISTKAINIVNESNIGKGFVCDIDEKNLPFEDNFFDLIFCGEVIEHVYDPQHLIFELKRVCKKDSLIFLTTPNLGSWFNRLSLLFGYMPIFYDSGFKFNCGHLWKMDPMGHLRLYTYRALKKLLFNSGLKIIKSFGIGINYRVGFGARYKLITALTNVIFCHPEFSSGILLVLTPKE